MKLGKKGQASIEKKLTGIIIGVVAVVVLITASPALYDMLKTATDNSSFQAIPIVGSMSGLIGILFGVGLLLGILGYLFYNFKNKR